MSRTLSVSRTDLYNFMWTAPLIEVAMRLGIPPSQLARLCVKHLIPKPWTKQWTTMQEQVRPPIEPLPPVVDPMLDRVNLFQSPEGAEAQHAEDDEINRLVSELLARPPIAVPPVLRKPHRLVAVTIQGDLSCDEELVSWSPTNGALLRIEVSKVNRPRAYRIMDALLKAGNERGFKFYTRSDRPICPQVVFGFSTFGVRLYEMSLPDGSTSDVCETRTARNAEKEQPPSVRKGALCLQLLSSNGLVLFNMRDGPRQSIEDQLNQYFIAALLWIDDTREYGRASQRERDEADRRCAAENAKRIEQEQIAKLHKEVSDWRISQEIQAYLAALRQAISENGYTLIPGSKLEKRMQWADAVSRSMNPLNLLATHNPHPEDLRERT